MLKYLIIKLCDTAPSFCHYYNPNNVKNLMTFETLKESILFGMKENLNIQFLYPDYELPTEYKEEIDKVDHTDIVSFWNKDKELLEKAEIVVIDSWHDVTKHLNGVQSYILRTSKDDFFKNYKVLMEVLLIVQRINIVFTDISECNKEDLDKYKNILEEISDFIAKEYISAKTPQTNILTDRFLLKSMNNCNAGDEVITVAPDGKFYVCPAFYLYEEKDEGNLRDGLKVRNSQLYKLSHAPICRQCDAYQCKRCVWLNKQMTLEVNTPSREQCVIAHLERNQTRKLLQQIRVHGIFMPEIEIPEINYLDPFDKIVR
ncbi:MAG: CXXX repeat peptide maturase [Muribaculaceae bacterium]|nr:CXXX repeat peptide maturase [Muribaculaceae bacterium]